MTFESFSKNQTNIINPVRIIGTHQSVAFCTIINDSTIAYASEKRLLMENIKTNQQSTIWTNQFDTDIQAIAKVNCYNDTKIAVGLKDTKMNKYCIVLLQIDWGGYMFRKQRQHKFYLQSIDLYDQIKCIQFGSNGQILCIMTNSIYNSKLVFVQINITNEENFLQTEEQIVDFKAIKLMNKNYFSYTNKQQVVILSVNSKYIHERIRGKIPFLQEHQYIIKIQYYQSKKNQVVGFVLTSFGFFIIFKLLDGSFEGLCKCDVKINKRTNKVNTQNTTNTTYLQEQFILPSCFGQSNNKIVLGYENFRKLVYISYSILNNVSYSIHMTENILFFPDEDPQKQINQMDSKVRLIQLSSNSCSCCVVIENQNNKIYIQLIDTFTSLIVNEKSNDSINYSERVFGNYNCQGQVISSSYIELDSTLMVLHQNKFKGSITLSAYFVNYLQIVKIKPKKLLLWNENLKGRPFQIHLHICAYSLMLVYEDVVKFHNHNKYKIYEPYASFNVQKCECACFSPLGDKVIVGSQSKILIIDFYTMEIFKVLSPNILNKRTMKQAKFISTFDLLVQFGSSVGSYLSILKNYNEFSVINQKQFSFIQNNISVQRCQSLKDLNKKNAYCFDLDQKNEHMIIVEKGDSYKIYDNQNREIMQKVIKAQYIKLLSVLGIMLVGTSDGSVVMERWPKKVNPQTQEELSFNKEYYIVHLHSSAIVNIYITLNYRFMIVVSKNGQFSVCQLCLQSAGVISKTGSLYLLKKWPNKMSLSHLCLNSNEQETKRNETITKTIGKEVFIVKKNEQKVKNIEKQMESKFEEDIMQFEEKITQQLEICQQQKQRKIIIRKIERIKNQLQKMETTRVTEKQQMTIKHREWLYKCFRQREKLQLSLSTIMQKNKQEEEDYKKMYMEDTTTNSSHVHTQMQEYSNNMMTHHQQQHQRRQVNRGYTIQLQEDKAQQTILICSQFDIILEELLVREGKLKSQQRKYQGLIQQYRQKINTLSLSKMELGSELQVLKEKNVVYKKNVAVLNTKIQQFDILNEKYIKKERGEEVTFKEVQRQATYAENKYHELLQEVQQKKQMLSKLQKQIQEADQQFWIQHEKKRQLKESEINVIKRIKQLKESRRKNHIKNTVLKNHHSSLEKKCSHPISTVKQKVGISLSNSRVQMMNLKEKRDKLIEKTNKMNKIRNEKIKKFKLYEARLGNDSKRLVSQYNQLKTYNQNLHKKQQKVKSMIKDGGIKKQAKKVIKPKIKKGVFVSLHNTSKEGNFITELL